MEMERILKRVWEIKNGKRKGKMVIKLKGIGKNWMGNKDGLDKMGLIYRIGDKGSKGSKIIDLEKDNLN